MTISRDIVKEFSKRRTNVTMLMLSRPPCWNYRETLPKWGVTPHLTQKGRKDTKLKTMRRSEGIYSGRHILDEVATGALEEQCRLHRRR